MIVQQRGGGSIRGSLDACSSRPDSDSFAIGTWNEEDVSSADKGKKISKNSVAFRSIQSTLRGNSAPSNSVARTRGENTQPQFFSEKGPGNFSASSSSNRFQQKESFGRWGRQQKKYGEHKFVGSTDFRNFSPRTAGSVIQPVETIRNAFLKFEDEVCSLRELVEVVTRNWKALDEFHWQEIVSTFVIGFAVTKGDIFIDSAVEICVKMIDKHTFQIAVFNALMENLGEIMNPYGTYDNYQGQNLCNLMGKLLVVKWPKMYDSSAKECNQIVFAILSAVYGWLRILEEYCKQQGRSETVESVETYAQALICLTQTTRRKLWEQRPELVDQLYEVLRPLIVISDSTMSRDTKYDLLNLFVAINDWTKPRYWNHHSKVQTSSKTTQTDPALVQLSLPQIGNLSLTENHWQ